MSRVRTNTVRSYNTDTVTVENPTLSGQIKANGVRVLFANPSNGQVLAYDSAAQQYRPTTFSASGSVATLLRELTDVAITTDANGDPIITDGAVLQWNTESGVWVASDTLDGGGYS